MAKRAAPEVNAGSMADIAFLLLIFFLVTTTIAKEKGQLLGLPPIQDQNVEPPVIKQKNLFTVLLNRNNQLLVEEELMEVADLKQAAIDFLDNGGGANAEGKPCDYCKGKRLDDSSDHPDKAIISFKYDRETKHGKYIEVQDQLLAAYGYLRDREAMRLYGRTFKSMLEEKEKNQFNKDEKLNNQIKNIQTLFPQKLSEAEPENN